VKDWVKVIKIATESMGSNGPSLPNEATAPTSEDRLSEDRLSACFLAFCLATGNLHRAKIVQNFAGTALHLCFLLRVSMPIYSKSSLYQLQKRRATSTYRRTKTT
jgi:hypothetical protein